MYLSEVRNGERIKAAAEQVVFDESYDVIVSGLGTAGSMAALMAAENGLKVLGIEQFNCVGGTTTIGGIEGHYFGCPGGRYIEFDEKVAAFQRKYTRNQLESRKIVIEDMLIRNGAELLYESSICGVYLEGCTVVGVKVITPDGFKNFRSVVLMDCTGDGVTADMAGCEWEYGRKLDGMTQPYSMVAMVHDGDKFYSTNFDFGRVDQRDDMQLSKAIIFSRAFEMQEERQNVRFIGHMPLIGIREGRRIVAEETVHIEEVFADKQTKQPAFYSYADLDKHGWDIAFDGPTLGDWAIGANIGAYNVTIAVPYKTIIPKGIDGMLVPCRALGVDRDVLSCVRMVPSMKKVAEVGADMAMLAVKHHCRLREIPYEELRDRLLASGCLDASCNYGYRIDGWVNYDGKPLAKEEVHFLDSPDQLKERLATLTPGLAIWSAKRMGEKAVGTLRGLLDCADENMQKHAAFALAIIGNTEGIDILREMVKQRDGTMLVDCRKHNNQRGSMAIYFLGRLADAEITDTLIEIITDKKENTLPAYNQEFSMGTRYKISGFKNEYFQFMSNAVMALIRIADEHSQLRSKVASAFRTAFGDKAYYERITDRPLSSIEGSMVINMKHIADVAAERWDECK